MENRIKKIMAGASTANKFLYSTIFEGVSDSEKEEDAHGSVLNMMLVMIRNRLDPRKENLPRIEGYYEQTIPRYNPSQFRSHFRMLPEAFNSLCELIIPRLQENYVTGRPLENPRKQILSIIWLLATPDSFRSVGDRFNLGKASVSDAFMRTIKVLNKIAPQIIKWPTVEERMHIQQRFRTYAGMDGVIGAVDGTYIPIRAPKIDSEVYITRKCNPALKFIDALITYPGSVTDGRIFRNSEIYKQVRKNIDNFFNNNYILADKAYPILTWCIPPYIERQRYTAMQRHFNTIHSKTRQVVERSFALLFGRFRRLKYLDLNRVDLILQAVIACCVIHNICLHHDDLLQQNEYIQEGYGFLEENDNNENFAEDILFHENVDDAVALRNNLAQILYENRG